MSETRLMHWPATARAGLRRSAAAVAVTAAAAGLLVAPMSSALAATTCGPETNTFSVNIPDLSTAESRLYMDLGSCGGIASTDSRVDVTIVHPRMSDLVISLIAPSGRVYVLRDRIAGFNLRATYWLDLSNNGTESQEGTWTLRLEDVRAGYAGHLKSWTLAV